MSIRGPRRASTDENRQIDFLPAGLHKADIPDYLLSKSFEKRAGLWLPRREVLLGLSAMAAYAAIPVRPANAISGAALGATIALAISAVELIKSVWDLAEKVAGEFNGSNNEEKPQAGTIIIAICDEDDRVEVSQGRNYKIPKNTEVTLRFKKGPAPEEYGKKTLYVCSRTDYATTDFEVAAAESEEDEEMEETAE